VKQQAFMVPKPFNWKIFSTLLAASILGILAVLPYSLALQAKALASAPPPMPLAILIPIQILQNAMLFALVIAAGLWAANRTDLSFPILEDALAGRSIKDRLKGILLPSISVGVIASLLIILLEITFFKPMLAAQLGDRAVGLYSDGATPSAWKGLLASFYGGINEEILLRLGLMSLLVWLGKLIGRTGNGHPTPIVFWAAICLAAIIFGLGHLPATALLIPLTPLVIARAVILNGLAGIGFGWLFWKRGLESAMISHFSADIVLHVLLAL
jgi:hypothetical protein